MDDPSCPAASGDTLNAGKATACQGCPGAQFCQRQARAEAVVGRMRQSGTSGSKRSGRLKDVQHTLLVLSGKGGVGKSSIAALLALALCEHGQSGAEAGARVAMLDADLCGPSQPTIMGVVGAPVAAREEGWVPPVGPDASQAVASLPSGAAGAAQTAFQAALDASLAPVEDFRRGARTNDVAVASKPELDGAGIQRPPPSQYRHTIATLSIGNLLPSADTAVVWRGPRKTHMLMRMLRDTAWGKRDWLIVDTPPGTSDEHLAVIQTLKQEVEPFGAILVTTPQQVALQTVRKELRFCTKMGIRVLGIVENMATVVCPCCDREEPLFSRGAGAGAAALAAEAGVPFLGSIPLDPRVAEAVDRGQCVNCSLPDSPTVIAARLLARTIVQETPVRIGSE